ncbi:hypothetical protein GCM10022221_23760 [Actinocorallia aurea]
MSTPEKILVAGDWHGNGAWARDVIRRLPALLPDESPRLVLHCGDFGVWPGGEEYLREVDTALAEADAVLGFVDGNHEQFPVLHAAPELDGRGRVRDRVWHLRRGHRWTWHGRTWLALGGAVTLDAVARTEGETWWPEEEITEAEAEAVRAAGPADVMVTHDCPPAVGHEWGPPPSWWARADVDRNEAHRALLQAVVDDIRPSHLIHGHLHRPYQRTAPMPHGPVCVTGLAADGDPANWSVLNVRTMDWSPVPADSQSPVTRGS